MSDRSRTFLGSRLLLLGALIATSFSCRDGLTEAVPPLDLPLVNRIVFLSYRADTLADVYVMGLDGSDVRRLTDASTRDDCPVISPDGNWIAFLQTRLDGAIPYEQLPESLAVMKANGTGLRMFAKVRDPIKCPVWSRDSRLLAVEDINSSNQVRTFAIEGQQIASFSLSSRFDLANFSPDGSRFVGRSFLVADWGPYADTVITLGIDGTGKRSLAAGFNPEWSPVSNEIFYGCSGICVVHDVEGDSPRTLAVNDPNTWFPGGFAFTSDGSTAATMCGSDTCLVNVKDGSVAKVGTNGPSTGQVWTANNQQFVFVCSYHAYFIGDICIVGRNGSGLTVLTKDYPLVNDLWPSVSQVSR